MVCRVLKALGSKIDLKTVLRRFLDLKSTL